MVCKTLGLEYMQAEEVGVMQRSEFLGEKLCCKNMGEICCSINYINKSLSLER
jgi:hypothetical protein